MAPWSSHDVLGVRNVQYSLQALMQLVGDTVTLIFPSSSRLKKIRSPTIYRVEITPPMELVMFN